MSASSRITSPVSLLNQIARQLNAEGIPGPRGHLWRPGAIRGNADYGLGVLRNKLYIGIFEWGRSVRKHNRRKGSFTTKATPVSSRLVMMMPHLRIVDDALFEAAQARLNVEKTPRFYEKRKPEYLLSGLVRCGVCNSRYSVLHERLGCVGHALMGVCNNRRRVLRQDIEEAVLDGLRHRLATPHNLDHSLREYRAEVERAVAEQKDRIAGGALRLKEVERQIENIVSQVRDGKVQGFAGQVLMGELDQLEAERQQHEREAKQVSRNMPVTLDPEAVTRRLHAALDDLAAALSTGDREAARARELLRDMIDRVVITPIALPKEDGRGIGPVRITVEGRLAPFLDFADGSRVIQHRSGPRTTLDRMNLTFSFYVDLIHADARLFGVYADLPVVARLLDDADAPVTKRAFLKALAGGRPPSPGTEEAELEGRMRHALQYLRDRDEVRTIRLGPAMTGTVWNHIALSDEQWKAKAFSPKEPPIAVIRLSPPEAYVVTIGKA